MQPPIPREAVIFDAVLQLAPEQRSGHLDQVCGKDTSLRQRIEALLKAAERTSDFLDQPAGSGLNPGSAPFPAAEKPGDIIGPYKLLQQIGEGGCGVVYMAEQEKPVQRRVALKVIKLGMDTRSVIARFEAERQALALMDHPNIAKVLEAGATDAGRPYFVMELVRGVKITEFCDHNNLSTAARLDLFMQVCRAIQHAHQKGIIHRDIKPSNILVTLHDGAPVPKVIDFGIAKATQGRLTDKTVFTAFEQFLGTPAYTSPEQAEMTSLDIDTRSDIYSLGVLLYELLTGKTPFETKDLLAAGLDAMRRIIREKEPERPSTKLSTMLGGELTITANRRQTAPPKLLSSVRGDLDWIVMKCLEKDRARRYETANGLVSDLQRHLNQEPVLACPPSKRYRFQKLVRRNTLAIAAGMSIAGALVIGLGLATWMFFEERTALRRAVAAERRAQAGENAARTEAAKSKQVARVLKNIFEGVGPKVALGRDATLLQEMLDKTAEAIGIELTNQPVAEIELRLILADTYGELGLWKQEEEMARKTLELVRATFGDHHPDVAEALELLGHAEVALDHIEQAETHFREALALVKQLNGTNDLRVPPLLNALAGALVTKGALAESEDLFRETLAMRRRLLPAEHEDIAFSLHQLAGIRGARDDPAQAEKLEREALDMRRKLLPADHPDVAQSLNNLGLVLDRLARLPEAEDALREALEIRRKVLGETHSDLAVTFNNLAIVLHHQEKLGESEAMYRKSLEIRKKAFDSESPKLANALNNLAVILDEEGKLNEAEALYGEALRVFRKKPGDHSLTANTLNGLAHLLRVKGGLGAAEALNREALAMRLRMSGSQSVDAAKTLAELAVVLQLQGKLVAAETTQREALAMRRKLQGDAHPATAGALGILVDILMRQARFEEAEGLVNQVLTPVLEARTNSAELLRARANLRARRSQWKEAKEDLSKAFGFKPGRLAAYHSMTLLHVATGDLESYRESCRQALARLGTNAEPISAAPILQDCLVLPSSGVDLDAVGQSAEAAVLASASNYFLPTFQFCQALAQYRQGRFASAAESVAGPLSSSGQVSDETLHVEAWMVKAMAHWHLKQAEEARAALATGSEIAQTKLPHPDSPDLGSDWRDWLVAQSLMREARALIEGATEPGIELK